MKNRQEINRKTDSKNWRNERKPSRDEDREMLIGNTEKAKETQPDAKK